MSVQANILGIRKGQVPGSHSGILPLTKKGNKPPLSRQTDFRFTDREDMVLIDKVGGDGALILGGYRFSFDGETNLEFAVVPITKGGFFEINDVNISSFANYPQILEGVSGGFDYFRIDTDGKVRMYIENVSYVLGYTANINTEYCFRVELNDTIDLFVNRNLESQTAWDDTLILNVVNMGGGYSGRFVNGVIGATNLNDSKYFGLNENYTDSVTGMPATIIGVEKHLLNNTDQLSSITKALNSKIYELVDSTQIIDPKFPKPIGAVEHKGGLHNLTKSYIDFSNSSAKVKAAMNKADATRWLQPIRDSVHCDTDNYYLWYIDELDYDYMLANSTEAYKNKIFVGMNDYQNKKTIFEIFGYPFKLEGQTLQRALKYINHD